MVARMPAFVVLGGLHVFPEPPTDHPRRDYWHTGEYRDVNNAVGEAFDTAQIGEFVGGQECGEVFEAHQTRKRGH